MIEIGRLKRALAVLLVVAGTLVGLLVLRQLAGAILRAATGADPASVFNEPPAPPSELLDVIEWLPDRARDGRTMEPATRRDITDAYARALAALDRAGRGDVDAPLGEYLGGPALTAALGVVADQRTVITTTVHLRQELELSFYSDDGAIVAVTAPAVEHVRTVDGSASGDDVRWSGETWRFVMVLEDGNWRLHQLEIVEVEVPDPPDRALRLREPIEGVNTVTVHGGDPTWTSYEPSVAAAEIEAIIGLGLDTVRIFVAGPEFGRIDTEALRDFLDQAANRGISVVPVLFDGSADHRVSGWRDDRDYLKRVVRPLAGHESIVMWDLKNEPDLDDERSGGPAVVNVWLGRVAADVRAIDPDTPLTVGWSAVEHATRSLDSVDVVSFHHFGAVEELEVGVETIRISAPERQLVVSEFGRPAWLGFMRGAQPSAQAAGVDELVEALDRLAVDGSMVWVLRDPGRPIEDGVIAGRASQSYGLLRGDGSERSVAMTIRTRGAAVDPQQRLVERARSWLTPSSMLTVLGVSVCVGMVARRRRRLSES